MLLLYGLAGYLGSDTRETRIFRMAFRSEDISDFSYHSLTQLEANVIEVAWRATMFFTSVTRVAKKI